MEEIEVALAAEHEARACLSLLPEAVGLPVELLIAKVGGVMAGAGAIFWQNWTKPAGFPTLVHVLPERRLRGVGRALVAFADDLAAEDTDGLWSFKPLDHDVPAVGFLIALGFAARTRQHYFECGIQTLLDYLAPLIARNEARRGSGASFEIVPLGDVALDEVGWLISSELGGGPLSAQHNLHQRVGGRGPGQVGPDRSQVAVAGDKIAGAILWRIDDGVAVVDARVTAPAWRIGALSLQLLVAALLRGRADGLTAARFHCDETVTDTMRLAKRCNAVETAQTALYYRPFD
jgi:GNAT superfamily N-acetyltransferase